MDAGCRRNENYVLKSATKEAPLLWNGLVNPEVEVEVAENGPSLSQRQKGNNLLGGTVAAKMASAGIVA